MHRAVGLYSCAGAGHASDNVFCSVTAFSRISWTGFGDFGQGCFGSFYVDDLVIRDIG